MVLAVMVLPSGGEDGADEGREAGKMVVMMGDVVMTVVTVIGWY